MFAEKTVSDCGVWVYHLQNYQSAFLDQLYGLVVTLNFDLLTSKSNQFIIVEPNCTEVVNLVKLPPAVYIYMMMHIHTVLHGQQENASVANYWQSYIYDYNHAITPYA